MTDLRTPSEWEKEFNYRIKDADGWDRQNFEEDWAKPITREEFMMKSVGCTIEGPWSDD
ncbi:hypothetical protein SEA_PAULODIABOLI_258 [Microbacterium phage PauloDiaboli]|nr:hypothetical protein SEA_PAULODIABOLI_258 [Microbacterium phage PauloDiaboli]QWY84065.1 hypothetical protein SEA_A3WALLY_258 [Microbacterium phage A3Wally]